MTEVQSSAINRRGFMKVAGAFGAAATMASALSACGTRPDDRGASGGAKSDGTLNAGVSYELGTNGFDPMTTSAALTVAANWHTMEGLTEITATPDRQVYAALAAELPVKIDGTTYEVSLRDGARFHDGSDVTADDVVFSFERVLDEENSSLYAAFLDFLDSIEAKDDKTVTIRLKHPFTLVPERLAVVKIVPKAVVESDPKAFDAMPVGTGPFKLTDNSSTSKRLVFERFDDYSGPYPARVAKMVWSIMPDDSTRMNATTSKSIQAMDSVPDLSIETMREQARVETVQGFSLLFAMFNCGAKPFDDVRNRQAFLYAVDVDKIIDTAYLGNASAASCFVPESHPAYTPASTVYSFDRDKARALFAETGLRSIRMLCTDHAWVQRATPIIKESLESVGLKVDFIQQQSADLYNTIDGKPEAYDVVIAPGDPSVFGNDADLLMRWWYSADTWTDQRMHWKGQDSYEEVQELLERAAREEGSAQRESWGALFNLLSETVPLYPLFHRKAATAWDNTTLPGFRPISLTGLSFIDVSSTK